MDFKSYAISLKVSLRLTLDSFHLRVKVSYYESCKVTLFLSLSLQFIAKCAISFQGYTCIRGKKNGTYDL